MQPEYDDIMGHGNVGNQMMAIATENQVLVPFKESVKLNILQFQQADTLFNREKNTQVTIDPVTLRQSAVHFKISDGLSPVDKEISGDELQTAMQVLGSSPSLGAAYNQGPLFSYMMKTRGLDLTPFEKSPAQQQYEQALQAWQQSAAMAAKAGAPFNTPMPQPSQQLQQELQQKSQTGGVSPSPQQPALDSTQGGGAPTVQGQRANAAAIAAAATGGGQQQVQQQANGSAAGQVGQQGPGQNSPSKPQPSGPRNIPAKITRK